MLGKIIKHPIFVTFIGTGLVTLIGVQLSNYNHKKTWTREKRFEVFQEQFNSSLKLIDELSTIMGQRLFGLNQVLWAANDSKNGNMNEVWKTYYVHVENWNSNLLQYKLRLSRLIDEDVAYSFYNNEDAQRSLKDEVIPETIHGHFMIAHKCVRRVVDCVRSGCDKQTKKESVKKANNAIYTLYNKIEDFIKLCNKEIYNRVETI